MDDIEKGEFNSTFRNISIAGFDINKDKTVRVKLQAIPINDDSKKKESKSRVCYNQYKNNIMRNIFICRNFYLLVHFLVYIQLSGSNGMMRIQFQFFLLNGIILVMIMLKNIRSFWITKKFIMSLFFIIDFFLLLSMKYSIGKS